MCLNFEVPGHCLVPENMVEKGISFEILEFSRDESKLDLNRFCFSSSDERELFFFFPTFAYAS